MALESMLRSEETVSVAVRCRGALESRGSISHLFVAKEWFIYNMLGDSMTKVESDLGISVTVIRLRSWEPAPERPSLTGWSLRVCFHLPLAAALKH